jgi:hypothetical protein
MVNTCKYKSYNQVGCSYLLCFLNHDVKNPTHFSKYLLCHLVSDVTLFNVIFFVGAT